MLLLRVGRVAHPFSCSRHHQRGCPILALFARVGTRTPLNPGFGLSGDVHWLGKNRTRSPRREITPQRARELFSCCQRRTLYALRVLAAVLVLAHIGDGRADFAFLRAKPSPSTRQRLRRGVAVARWNASG